jgi:DNA repair exonuclease SbcCD ATPase subunit
MQNTFGPIDCFKLAALLEETIGKINFLGNIQKEDEASSELAGYEINKLLKEQARLEKRYEELLKTRSTLTGISNKRKLDKTQKEIADVATNLKESTKKLCRLFREDPDFASDAGKIENERAELREMLEKLVVALNDGSYVNSQVYQGNIIKELENQDLLRKLISQEKALSGDIKDLHRLWKTEQQEFNNEQIEKQKLIQRHKEKLVKARTKADIETNYHDKEVKATEGMKNRLQHQALTDLDGEIEHYEKKKATELEVFGQISNFLKEKENEIKTKVDGWNHKLDRSEQTMDHEIQKLKNERDKAMVELEDLRKRFEMEEFEKRERERKHREKEDDKKRAAEEEENLENATKMIQDYYQAWKDAGGTVGKKKKKKKKKAK